MEKTRINIKTRWYKTNGVSFIFVVFFILAGLMIFPSGIQSGIDEELYSEASTIEVEDQPVDVTAGENIMGPPTANVTDGDGDPVEVVEVTVSLICGDQFDDGENISATNESGIVEFDDLVIKTAGTYQLNFSISEEDEDVSESDNCTSEEFDILSGEADSFDVSVNDITAGKEAIINITDAEDELGNDLDGEYAVNISIENNGDTYDNETTLNFTEGEGEYETDGLTTEADSYTATVEIDEATDEDTFEIIPDDVDYVEIDPEEDQDITAGDSLQFSASAYDEYDNLITDSDLEFNWFNTDGEGNFTETTAGEYEVRAEYDGESSPVTTVTVDVAEADNISIEPQETTIEAGGSQSYTAWAEDEHGNEFEVKDDIEWSDNIDGDSEWDDNEITVNEAGTWNITGEYNGLEDNATLHVETADTYTVEITPENNQTITAGDTIKFTAWANDTHGNVITNESIDFSWANTDDYGKFTKTSAGNYTVQASYGGVTSNTTNVTVEPAAVVDRVEISPSSNQTIMAGETIDFEASAYDEYDNLITDVELDFDWENATEGSFDNTTASEYVVTATYDGKSSEKVTVTVEPAGVDRVEISPSLNQTITAGETIDFEAWANDTYGNMITNTTIDFSWANTDDYGEFTKTSAGNYTVQASYGGVMSNKTNVTVEPAEEVQEVIITPSDDQTITAGDYINFTAEAYDKYDNLITDIDVNFTWNNTDEYGLFNKTDAREYIVNATFVDEKNSISVRSDNVTVTVEPAGVDRVEVYPSEEEIVIEAGEYIQFNATAYDEYDNLIVDENQSFNWMNTNEVGNFTKTTADEYEVRAEYGGVASQFITVKVEPGDPVYIMVEDMPEKITAGEEFDIHLKVFDGYHNTVSKGTHIDNLFITSDIDDETVIFSETSIITEENGSYTAEIGTGNLTDAGDHVISIEADDISKYLGEITVEAGRVHTVRIEPFREQKIEAGDEISFGAEAYDLYDNMVTDIDTRFYWTNTGGSGIFDETEAGEYEITAGYDGVTSETVLVTVESSEVEEVTISPSSDKTIEAGEEIDFSAEAYDKYGNLITGSDSAFDWLNTDEEGIFTETTTGSYQVRAYHDGVQSDEISVTVDSTSVSDFDLLTDDITAGEAPTIKIENASDGYENLLDGEYPLQIILNDETQNITGEFKQGEVEHEWEPIVHATFYEIEVSLDGQVGSDQFEVSPDKIDSIEILDIPTEINTGEDFEIVIVAYDEHGNPASDRGLNELTLNSKVDGEVYHIGSLVLDEQGRATIEIDGSGFQTIGDHTLYVRGMEKEGVTLLTSTSIQSEVRRGWMTRFLYLLGIIGPLSLYDKHVIGLGILLMVCIGLIWYHKTDYIDREEDRSEGNYEEVK